MIKSITIQGYKSFPADAPTIIDFTTKRIAVFYGINGAGKSAIGEVIHRNGNNQDPVAHCSVAMVANAMRGICERFFYFTRRQKDFKEGLKRIGQQDQRFSALARYLNRQSHANAENLTDFGDYDVNYYLDKFRMVFEQTQQMEHYRAMMGEEEEQAPEEEAPATS